MSEQANLELVQRNYAAFGSGDIPAVLNNLAESVVWDSRYPKAAPLGGKFEGHAGFLKWLGAVGESVAIKEFAPQKLFAQGDTVVVLGYEVAEVKATQRTYRNDWVHVFTLAGGKIARFQSSNDAAAVEAAFV
jgi:uncharacterized protein